MSPTTAIRFRRAGIPRVVSDTSRATAYSPWRTFLPRYWLPTIDQGIAGGYRFGFETSGYDVDRSPSHQRHGRVPDEQYRDHRLRRLPVQRVRESRHRRGCHAGIGISSAPSSSATHSETCSAISIAARAPRICS